MSDRESENTSEQFLTSEIERIRKQTSRTWKFGLAASFIVLAYFSVIAYQFKSIVLNPSILAHVAAVEVNNNANALLPKLEKDLTEGAPQYTKRVSDELRSFIPVIEQAGKEQIDTLYGLVPVLHQESAGVIPHYFRENADIIREFYDAHNQQGFADHFVNAMVDGLISEIDKDFSVQYGGQTVHGIKKVSLLNLHHMNESLKELAGSNPFEMNRSERLQRRLIIAWFNALTENEPL